MKHAILGAGAIGGLVGTALASLGEDVTMLVRAGKSAELSRALDVGTSVGPAHRACEADAMLTESVDVLWIATKTYQLQTALEAVHRCAGCVVPLLNGVDHRRAPARFGQDRLSRGRSRWKRRIAPGRFIQRSPFVRLNLASSGELLLGAIVAQLRNVAFTCQFIPNEQTLCRTRPGPAKRGYGSPGLRETVCRDRIFVELGAIVATRRRRSPTEPDIWAATPASPTAQRSESPNSRPTGRDFSGVDTATRPSRCWTRAR